MTQEAQTQDTEARTPPDAEQRAPLSDYLWRPWYARLWWAAIPAYWIGMEFSSRIPLLADFYDLAFAGYLNVLFFPPTALMVLGVGYVRERMGPVDWSDASDSNDEFDFPNWDRGPSGFPYYADPLDPRSGPLWIGYSHPPTSR
jgi:hypothetical protein